ncbi:MAG: hypothetical protein JW715_14035 [Sedimentisphaerales bacterium]|nr:hypothetical protein [Sedimentisphaerales bacterium]
MKKFQISAIAILVILAVTLGLYAQPGGGAGAGARGGQRGGMGMRGFGRAMYFLRAETAEPAIAAIEAQLKKLKEVIAAQPDFGGFQDMSEEERTKMREDMQKRSETIGTAMTTIENQVMVLKGGRNLQMALQEETDALQAIADSAEKEKATATAKMVQELIAKKTKALEDNMEKLGIRGMRGGRMGGGGFGGQRGEGGQRRGGGQQ